MKRPKYIKVQFADSFTEKTFTEFQMTFTYDPVRMMRGEITEWIKYMKPVLDSVYRKKDALHGKILTKIDCQF